MVCIPEYPEGKGEEPMGRLEGKLAVVTGASGGLGFAIVEEFLREGACVAAVCHTKEGHLAELISEQLHIYHMNVCDTDSVYKVCAEIVEELGDPEILVNNAGVSDSALFFAMEDAVWDKVLKADLYGPRNVTRQLLLPMVRRRKGSIINMSSVSGIAGAVGQTNYCAAKAGLIGMTKALAREMAGKKIRVNAIAPGYIDTEMVAAIPEKQREQFLKSIPMKRFGKPEEVAKLAVFLASEEASYITGQTFVIDGGLSA